jgi:transposase-like protein
VLRELSVAEQRYQAILAVIEEGLSVTEVAAKAGVSRQTLHSWLDRYAAGGVEGLADRSHRPSSCPHQMPAAVEVRLVELRPGSKSAWASTGRGSRRRPRHRPAARSLVRQRPHQDDRPQHGRRHPQEAGQQARPVLTEGVKNQPSRFRQPSTEASQAHPEVHRRTQRSSDFSGDHVHVGSDILAAGRQAHLLPGAQLRRPGVLNEVDERRLGGLPAPRVALDNRNVRADR